MEFALDKIQRSAEGVAPQQRTPELRALLDFAGTMQDAEGHLKAAAAAVKEGAAVTDEAVQPEAFKGLVKFVRAVALGAEAAGVGLCSAEVLTLLKESLLQPIIAKDESGAYRAHRPSVACPEPTPTNILQLLASGVFLHVTGNPEPAIAMLSAALSGVWPPSRPMQRRLVARQFVPSMEREADSSSPHSGTAAGASGTQSPSSNTEHVAQPAGSEDQSQAQAETDAMPPPTALAVALGEALARHCPDVSLADVQKAALVLRLFLGCRAVGEQAGEGPSFQAILRTLLMDCQQLMDLDPSCMHSYVWAAQLALYARWPLDGRRVEALLQEGLTRSKEAQCWLAAAEVQHDFALWRARGAARERNVAVRQAALLEAGKLLEGVKEAEAQLESWMPAGRLQQLRDRRQQLGDLLQQLQAGQMLGMGAPAPRPGLSSCAFCGKLTLQLRTCGACKAVGYCSRECQVKDWKEGGHKQHCSELAPASGHAVAAGPGAAAAAKGNASGQKADH